MVYSIYHKVDEKAMIRNRHSRFPSTDLNIEWERTQKRQYTKQHKTNEKPNLRYAVLL